MYKALVTFFTFITICCKAQEQAYYVCEGTGADLLLVDMYRDSCVLDRAFVFGDSISTVQGLNPYYFPLRFLEFPDSETKGNTNILAIPFYSRSIDSVYVEGKWHIIEYKFSDDHFIGGRPNQVNQQISVSDIGIIYSSSNFIWYHMAFMLCHSDTSKQRVLQGVYKHLKTNSSWLPYHAMADLATEHTFNHCLSDLGKYWRDMRNHLQLVSCRINNIDGRIFLKVVIKNTSDVSYALPSYYRIGPPGYHRI